MTMRRRKSKKRGRELSRNKNHEAKIKGRHNNEANLHLGGVDGALDDVEDGDVAAPLRVRGHHDVLRLRQPAKREWNKSWEGEGNAWPQCNKRLSQ